MIGNAIEAKPWYFVAEKHDQLKTHITSNKTFQKEL